MKSNLAVALLCAVMGGLIGAAIVVALAPSPAPPQGADAEVVAEALERAMAAHSQEMADALRALDDPRPGRARDPSPAAETPAPAPSPAAAAPSRPVPGGRSPTRPVVKEADIPNPPAQPERLEEVVDWRQDPEIRRRWMFADSEEVLRWFGTPDQVDHGTDHMEHWYYNLREDRRRLHMRFLHGRLTEIRKIRH